eukprot:2494489-Pleurochrysis_carterae.AAC.1
MLGRERHELSPPRKRERRAARVAVCRHKVDQRRRRQRAVGETRGEQVGAHALGVAGDADDTHARIDEDLHREEVGGLLHQQHVARR